MRFNPTALMGNNPIVQLINVARGGGNPDMLVQQLISQHPQREQIQQIIGGKSPDQLMQIAQNMCRERGTTMDQVLQQFGISR